MEGMTETASPEAPDRTSYVRTVVLIDAKHDSAHTGAEASITVPYAVALDDSLRLPGVAFTGVHLSAQGALLVTLRCATEHVHVAEQAVLIHGIQVLTPPFSDDSVRADGNVTEVDLYAQAVLVRAPRADEATPLGGGGYQNWQRTEDLPVAD